MSQPPEPYERQYNFTDYQTSNPSAPLPGQKVDQELNEVLVAINQTQERLGEIQADDGMIRISALDLQVVAENVEPLLTDAPLQAIQAAGNQQVGLVNNAGNSKIAQLNSILSSQNAQNAINAAQAAETSADVAASSAVLANGYAGSAQAYANTALQAKNSAIANAQAAQDAVNSIPLIVGPAGPAGQQGIQGVPGEKGDKGDQGDSGVISASSPLSYDQSSKSISINLASYAPLNAPVFTGDARAVTPALGDNDTSIATTAFVKGQGYITSAPVTSVAGRTGAITLGVADVSGAAPLASPVFTGDPRSVTPSLADNDTSIATTAFVKGQSYLTASALTAYAPLSGATFTGQIICPNVSGVSGSQGADQTYQTYYVGQLGYFQSVSHRTSNTAEEGMGDNSYVDYSNSTSIDTGTGRLTFSAVTYSGDNVTATEKTINLRLDTLSLAMSDGVAGLTLSQGNGLVVYDGSNGMSFTPTGIIFPDSSVQTTAAVTFDPTGYATESWVASQGYAPLDSPAFTGTPTAVTQSAGDNTTALATTAFVTASNPDASTTTKGHVELATNAETVAGTSTTLAVTPNGLEAEIVSPTVSKYFSPAWVGGSIGTGSSALNVFGNQRVIAPTSAVGVALRNHPISQNVRGVNPDNGAVNFSKRIVWGFRLIRYAFGTTDVNSVCRVVLGKTGAVGTPTTRSIGIYFTGTSVLSLMVHDGTTLRFVDTTFTPVHLQGFDAVIISDGTGNVSLFVNGTLAATSANGPVGNSASTPDHRIEAENIAVLTGSPMGAYYSNHTISTEA